MLIALLPLLACTGGTIALDDTAETTDTADTADTADTQAPSLDGTYTGPFSLTRDVVDAGFAEECDGTVAIEIDGDQVSGALDCTLQDMELQVSAELTGALSDDGEIQGTAVIWGREGSLELGWDARVRDEAFSAALSGDHTEQGYTIVYALDFDVAR